jgi:hypothetical protein
MTLTFYWPELFGGAMDTSELRDPDWPIWIAKPSVSTIHHGILQNRVDLRSEWLMRRSGNTLRAPLQLAPPIWPWQIYKDGPLSWN